MSNPNIEALEAVVRGCGLTGEDFRRKLDLYNTFRRKEPDSG